MDWLMDSVLYQFWPTWSTGGENQGWMADLGRTGHLHSGLLYSLLGTTSIQYALSLVKMLMISCTSPTNHNDPRMARSHQPAIQGTGH